MGNIASLTTGLLFWRFALTKKFFIQQFLMLNLASKFNMTDPHGLIKFYKLLTWMNIY